jgi:hypothetical protein
MLAKQDWHFQPDAAPDVEYNGYPFWQCLMSEPNREVQSAKLLQRVNVHAYVPLFSKQRRCRGTQRSHHHRQCAVVPCMIFVPVEMLEVRNREQILEWAKLRRSRVGRPLTKAEVEIIREIEAKLNRRFDKKTFNFLPEQRVRFLSELWAAYLGEAKVIEVASDQRIRVKSEGKLFGGKDTFWVPAAELEAM